jgi:hypothetical protein
MFRQMMRSKSWSTSTGEIVVYRWGNTVREPNRTQNHHRKRYVSGTKWRRQQPEQAAKMQKETKSLLLEENEGDEGGMGEAECGSAERRPPGAQAASVSAITFKVMCEPQLLIQKEPQTALLNHEGSRRRIKASCTGMITPAPK